MNVTIKPGEPAKLDEYLEIFKDSPLWDHYFSGGDTTLTESLGRCLEEGTVFIAESSSGEAVGLMQCEWNGMFGEWPYLALLGVKKNCRGMGIGGRLIDMFEATGKALGARNLFICVSGFNPRAKALYTRRGYKKIALVPDLYKNGIEENVLMKRIG